MSSIDDLTVRTISLSCSSSETLSEVSSTSSTVVSSGESSSSDDSNTIESIQSDSDSDPEEADHPVDQNDFAVTADRMNPLLKISFDRRGKTTNKRPRLLFRAFVPEHGLRARRFLDDSINCIPPPPRYEGNCFRNAARRHLTNDTGFSSPFLSFTESPLRAINIILNSKERLCLAVLDYNEVEAEMRRRYGKGVGIYLVPQLCKTHRLNRLWKVEDALTHPGRRIQQRAYTGVGEFLVWATVETDAVGVWDTDEVRKIVELFTSIKATGDISYESGLNIASCFDVVDDIYRQVIARKFLCAFKVTRCYEMKMDFEAFTRGLYREPEPEDDAESLQSEEEPGSLRQRVREAKKIRITVEVPAPPSTVRRRTTQQRKVGESPRSGATAVLANRSLLQRHHRYPANKNESHHDAKLAADDQYDDDKTQWLVDTQLAQMCAPLGIRVFAC